MESWKQIAGYEGFYEVSDEGRVRGVERIVKGRWGLMTRKPVMLAIHTDGGGYPHVVLCRDGRSTTVRVHKTVLEAFVGPCPDGMECCHRSGIRADCSLKNLRWDTKVANAADRVAHGTAPIGESNPRAKLTDSQATEIYERLADGERGLDLAVEFGVSEITVSHIACGRTWAHLTGRVYVKGRSSVTADMTARITEAKAAGKPLSQIVKELGISKSTAFRHGGTYEQVKAGISTISES